VPDGVIVSLLQDELGALPRRQDVLEQISLVDLPPDTLGDGDRLGIIEGGIAAEV